MKQLFSKILFKRCLIIIGLLLLIFGLYIMSFIYGKPTIETDYVAQINQLNKPENYNPEDNAWPYYKKAFELFIEPSSIKTSQIIYSDSPRDFSDYNDVEQELIEEWIEQNRPAWKQFIEASKKPYCYIKAEIQETSEQEIKDRDDPFIESFKKINVPSMKIISHVNDLRSILGFLAKWRLIVNVETGRTEQAFEDCFAFLNAAFQWQQGKNLVDEIIGIHLHSKGNEGLLKTISENELSLTQLKEIQDRLTDIYQKHAIELDFDSEKLQFLDLVQHVFTKGGIGGGHIIPKYLPPLVQMSSIVITMGKLDTEPTIKERFMFLAMSMLHARRNKTISIYNELFEQINKIQNMTLYERKEYNDITNIDNPDIFNFKIHFDSFTKQSKYFLINLYIPGLLRITEFVPQKKAEYEAAITVLALKRYELENGNYPNNLQDLIDAGYITKLPMDPYSDKPLIYRNTGNDFNLYSLGKDFEDNNGTPLFSGKHLMKWGDSHGKTGGDAVFWPVP